MGQYYNPVIYDDVEDKVYVYDLKLDDAKYGSGRKLMEHAYFHNPVCGAFNNLLIEKSVFVVWAGDYAEADDIKHNYCSRNLIEINNNYEDSLLTIPNIDSNPLIKYRYFVNHSTKEYFDLKKYLGKHSGNALNPVQILLCVGNGRGGGDYFCNNDDVMFYVGYWANCKVQIMNDIPEGYTELDIDFLEY